MVSGALASGSLSALCVQAASLGSGAQSPHRASRALVRAAWPDPLRIAFLTGAPERPGLQEACPGTGGSGRRAP